MYVKATVSQRAVHARRGRSAAAPARQPSATRPMKTMYIPPPGAPRRAGLTP